METVETVLVLLLAVVVSGAASRLLPFPVPRPLVQIALGSVIGLIGGLRVAFEPDLFFLLFLPPLLFLDGWRIPREEMLRDAKPILELALGLVVFTVLGAGYFIHWLVPAMPLPVAFALAAVLSPTDPIAVSAIAARAPIPKRLMHILEGESLLNDASGLVCFRFAVAAVLTGAFSLSDAAMGLAWVSLGGVVVGYSTTWLISKGKSWITERTGEETGSMVVVSLLIPFASYLIAEHIHCSGILAAVVAGITMSFIESSGRAMAVTRMQRSTVWDTIQFAASGIIFVILGEQLPAILASAPSTVHLTGHVEPWWLLVYVACIYFGLTAMRFIWVYVSLSLTILRASRRGNAGRMPRLRLVTATSLAGVRGAITLAGVLTLPVVMTDGTAFPARDLAISLAMGVIILSLVVASIGLPLLLEGLVIPADPDADADEDRARVAAAWSAITEVERIQGEWSRNSDDDEIHVAAASRILDFYRSRIEARSQNDASTQTARRREAIERKLLVVAVQAERATVFDLLRRKEIRSETAQRIIRELDLSEARFHEDPA